jgi:hypothetical protein
MLTCILLYVDMYFLYVDMYFLLTCMLKFRMYVDMHSPVCWHACWHAFFGMLTWTFYWHACWNFDCKLTCILLYVDMRCRNKNSCQHTGECMSTCSFWIRKRGCMLTCEQKHATWNIFDDQLACGVRCVEKFYSTSLQSSAGRKVLRDTKFCAAELCIQARARVRESVRVSASSLTYCVCVCVPSDTHTVKFMHTLNPKPYSLNPSPPSLPPSPPSPPLSPPPTVSEAGDIRSRLGFRV